jgi:hypothetical protein
MLSRPRPDELRSWMTTYSRWRTLLRPLEPRAELWARRTFGTALPVLTTLAGVRAIQLTVALYHDTARQPGGYRTYDPHGFGFMTLLYLLIPGTVLLAFSSASIWRKWSVPWWLPLLTILGLCGFVFALLSGRIVHVVAV